MTLIVGIKCSNGVVLGADGAATLGNTVGLRTVIQPVAKLTIVRDSAIVAVSGPVGIGQLFADRLDSSYNNLRNLSGEEVGRSLRSAFLQDAEVGLRIAALAATVVGSGPAQQDILCDTLVAVASKGTPRLIQFDYQCAPELATDDLPFVAIGSGRTIADPFLAFLRRVFWQESLPSLADGNFAATWTLQHAIDTAPGGIARPISVANLRVDKGQPVATLLSPSELMEHYEAIDEAEARLRQFRSEQIPGQSESAPPAGPLT